MASTPCPTARPWTLELVIPSDWNKVMQRVGFSIADSWTKAGFKVNARQVDNGEFNTVQDTNSLLQAMVNWSTSCVFNTNFVNNWRSFTAENLKDPRLLRADHRQPRPHRQPGRLRQDRRSRRRWICPSLSSSPPVRISSKR